MPRLTQEERAEVAIAVVAAKMRQEGIRLTEPSKFKRNIHNKARQIGISPDLAMKFTHDLVVEWLKQVFPEDPFQQRETV